MSNVMQIHEGVSLPNGIDSWQETHFEVTRYLLETEGDPVFQAHKARAEHGRNGVSLLARNITNAFELAHIGTDWNELDWYDEIDRFLVKFEVNPNSILND